MRSITLKQKRRIAIWIVVWILSFVFFLCFFAFYNNYRLDAIKLLNLKKLNDKEICILKVDKADFESSLSFQDKLKLSDLHKYYEAGVLGNVIAYPVEAEYGIENVVIISGLYCDFLDLPVSENEVYCMTSSELGLEGKTISINNTTLSISNVIPGDFEIFTPLFYWQKTDYRFRNCLIVACRDLSVIAEKRSFKQILEIQMCLDGGIIQVADGSMVSAMKKEMYSQYGVYLRIIGMDEYLIKSYHRDLKTCLSAVIFIVGALVFFGVFIIVNLYSSISDKFNLLFLRWLQGESIDRQYTGICLTVILVFLPIVLNIYLLTAYIIPVSYKMTSLIILILVVGIFFISLFACRRYRKYNLAFFNKTNERRA